MVELSLQQRKQIRQFFEKRFSLEELYILCFDLGIEIESLNHSSKPIFCVNLVDYFYRRGRLSCLLLEALRHRKDEKVVQILGSLPKCDEYAKVQIIVEAELINSEEILESIARLLGIARDEIDLVATSNGSIKLLISLPKSIANEFVNLHPPSLAGYSVNKVSLFDTLTQREKSTFREAFFDSIGITKSNLTFSEKTVGSRKVRDILQGKDQAIWSVEPEETVLNALKLMTEKGIGAVLVLEDGNVRGILSERDYVRKVVLQGRSSLNTPVKDVMTSRVFAVTSSHSVEDCMSLMTEKRIRHLLVMDEGSMVGVISIGDVVKMMLTEHSRAIDQLTNYILAGGYD